MNIEIRNATKIIKGNVVLDNVNLTLHGGNIYGLQGPNGSGKTMLMRLISGLIRPTSGEVWVDGQLLGRDLDFPHSMGLLLETPSFLPNHTGLKNLELLAQIQNRISEEEIRNTIKRVGLDPADKRPLRKYSLGMKQRLALAAAIMERPALLLLDEPFNALDERGVAQICQIIRTEKDRGALVILSCHDAEILDSLADAVYRVRVGNVRKQESPANAIGRSDGLNPGGSCGFYRPPYHSPFFADTSSEAKKKKEKKL